MFDDAATSSRGGSTTGSGTTTAVAVNSFDGQSFDTVYMVPNRSTIEMDVYNSEDRVEYHESYVFTGASSGVPTFEELDRDYFVYLFGQLHFHSDMYGLREINWLSDGAPSGKHANDGTYEQYQTDSSGRYTGTIKWYEPADTGYAAQDHLYTNWTRDAANRMLHHIRPYDFIGRYGGEEFLIVMPALPPRDAQARLDQLRMSISTAPFLFDHHSATVTSSFGVAWYSSSVSSQVDDLIGRADEALYRAKADGRDRIVFHSDLHPTQ